MTFKLYPNIEDIENFKVFLTEGERKILEKMVDLFNSPRFKNRKMEIFVQPNLFYLKPDIVVVEENSSVWIIEVKDYIKKSYSIELKGSGFKAIDQWKLTKDGTPISSPFKQVKKYKNELMSFVDPALEQIILKGGTDEAKNLYNNIFRTAVCFSNYDAEDILELKKELGLSVNTNEFDFNTILNITNLRSLEMFFETTESKLGRYKINPIKDLLLTDDQYKSLHSILDPGASGKNEPLGEFENVQYKEACESIPAWRKIRGAAGTGKTTVLAKRVANCAARLGRNQRILVVTFNKTMCNYIQDKVKAESGKTLNELGVQIIHFHGLYEWSGKRRGCKRFDYYFEAIFIDEGQDFKRDWYDALLKDYLKDYFLKEEKTKEFVVFADEGQNIYSRSQELSYIDESRKSLAVTPVLGNWRTLKENYRVGNEHIHRLAMRFSSDILDNPLTLLKNQESIDMFSLSKEKVNYQYKSEILEIVCSVRKKIKEWVQINKVPINDITILSGSRTLLRYLEEELRRNTKENNLYKDAVTTFVPEERVQAGDDPEKDNHYKMKFFRNIGPLKISTIHSFKGWESKYIILILHDPSQNPEPNPAYDEVSYVGITRAQDELFVIDQSGKYEELFRNMPQNVKID